MNRTQPGCSRSSVACLPLVLSVVLWGTALTAAMTANSVMAADSLVNNGGFEVPGDIFPYRVFTGTDMPGWTVETGTVEIVGTYWEAAEGTQSLDLNGIFEQIGTISQVIPTIPGQVYRIRFAYAGNPECGPVVKTTRVTWGGQEVATLSFNTTGHTLSDMGWMYHEFDVIAMGATSRLRFQSLTPTFCGPTLDDISVTPGGSTELPTVTLAAVDPRSGEHGPSSGRFRVCRSGSTNQLLRVHYSIGGTATAGSDYLPVRGRVTIKAGRTCERIRITPIDDLEDEPPETVELTLIPDPSYNVGSPSSGIVIIRDND